MGLSLKYHAHSLVPRPSLASDQKLEPGKAGLSCTHQPSWMALETPWLAGTGWASLTQKCLT